MKNASEASSKETRMMAMKMNPIAISIDNDKIEVITYAKNSISISMEEGFKEITAHDNEVVKVNGELRPAVRKNGKLKGIRVSKMPKAFEKEAAEKQEKRRKAGLDNTIDNR